MGCRSPGTGHPRARLDDPHRRRAAGRLPGDRPRRAGGDRVRARARERTALHRRPARHGRVPARAPGEGREGRLERRTGPGAGDWRFFAGVHPAGRDGTMALGIDVAVAGPYDPRPLPRSPGPHGPASAPSRSTANSCPARRASCPSPSAGTAAPSPTCSPAWPRTGTWWHRGSATWAAWATSTSTRRADPVTAPPHRDPRSPSRRSRLRPAPTACTSTSSTTASSGRPSSRCGPPRPPPLGHGVPVRAPARSSAPP
ncbi:hypothetical protein SUDANB176_05771 [Streptomyces sp. enrichment culture]